MIERITLDEFIVKTQQGNISSSGEFSALLRHLGIAAKIINRVVNKAGLMDIFGSDEQMNSTGDTVQKLDLYANKLMMDYMSNSGICAGVASEELDDFIEFEDRISLNRNYVVVTDPLDGSSNIDVNISVGTIFGIYKRLSPLDLPVEKMDFCQKGSQLVAAGYVLYGTSTMLVYTYGDGVNGFTYDRGIGEFCLSHPNMKIPNHGKIYSINQGNASAFSPAVTNYLEYLCGQEYALRYIGSMVADVHRTLCKGGIFIYPSTSKNPEGKLRLLYECNPMAMIIEQAGGICIDENHQRILDLEVSALHQRSTIVLGSVQNVEEFRRFKV
ncbi:MAG: class 1 fructose-bisphosphatase [Saprospiraceae bacterium]|nr:class 1 fructose-bisphosphatase [Saprospiraceae bacterium]